MTLHIKVSTSVTSNFGNLPKAIKIRNGRWRKGEGERKREKKKEGERGTEGRREGGKQNKRKQRHNLFVLRQW